MLNIMYIRAGDDGTLFTAFLAGKNDLPRITKHDPELLL